MEELDFIIDNQPSEEHQQPKNTFPKFSSSKFRLESDEEDDKSEASEEIKDSDEYFGKLLYFFSEKHSTKLYF